ncbi:unnamed protein product, partial [Prunus brigantina]
MAFPLMLSTNYPSFWKVDVGQGHGGRMTLLLMRPWRNCNAIDKDGRAWYDDSNLATFVWLSTSVAPMSIATALASPIDLCAQNDGPVHVQRDGLGHVVSDGLDFNLVSHMSRVTALPMAETTTL